MAAVVGIVSGHDVCMHTRYTAEWNHKQRIEKKGK